MGLSPLSKRATTDPMPSGSGVPQSSVRSTAKVSGQADGSEKLPGIPTGVITVRVPVHPVALRASVAAGSTSSVIVADRSTPARFTSTSPLYTPALRPAGFTLTLSTPGTAVDEVPVAGATVSHFPPSLVDTEA